MIIDTHVHYNLEPLAANWQSHWQKAHEHGVEKAIIVGSNFEDSNTAINIASNEPNLFAAIGLHPDNYSDPKAIHNWLREGKLNLDEATGDLETDIFELDLIDDNKKVVAIGEIGLDYYWLKDQDPQQVEFIKKVQQKALIKQLELAQKRQLPVIIHCRDKETPEKPTMGNAYWDLLEIIKNFSSLSFTLHCVSGPLQYIKQMNNLGAYMGFDGNITYPNALQIRSIFALCPPEKRLLETDAPYLPPQQHRGKMCEPWMISLTAEYIQTNLDQSIAQLGQNSVNLFHL